MASLGKTTLTGGSGKPYRFTLYALGAKLRKKSGVYVITSRSDSKGGGHRHATLFVGQTEDVSQPFDRHHKATDLLRHGANCICLHADESEDSRMLKERDLVAALHPMCND